MKKRSSLAEENASPRYEIKQLRQALLDISRDRSVSNSPFAARKRSTSQRRRLLRKPAAKPPAPAKLTLKSPVSSKAAGRRGKKSFGPPLRRPSRSPNRTPKSQAGLQETGPDPAGLSESSRTFLTDSKNISNLASFIEDESKSFDTLLDKENLPARSPKEAQLLQHLQELQRENTLLQSRINRLSVQPSPSRINRLSVQPSRSKRRRTRSISRTPRTPLSPFSKSFSALSFKSQTPRRKKHCKFCDVLLSKGYSTKTCTRHG